MKQAVTILYYALDLLGESRGRAQNQCRKGKGDSIEQVLHF